MSNNPFLEDDDEAASKESADNKGDVRKKVSVRKKSTNNDSDSSASSDSGSGSPVRRKSAVPARFRKKVEESSSGGDETDSSVSGKPARKPVSVRRKSVSKDSTVSGGKGEETEKKNVDSDNDITSGGNDGSTERDGVGSRRAVRRVRRSTSDSAGVDNVSDNGNDTGGSSSSDRTVAGSSDKSAHSRSDSSAPVRKKFNRGSPSVPRRRSPSSRPEKSRPDTSSTTESSSVPENASVREDDGIDAGVVDSASSVDYDNEGGAIDDGQELVVDEFDEQFAAFLGDDEDELESLSRGLEDNVNNDDSVSGSGSSVSVSPAALKGSGASSEGSGMGSRGGKVYSDRSRKSGYDKAAIVEKYAARSPKHKDKERFKHYTDQGTVTGRQIQFYRNLNLSFTYDKHRVADMLKPPVDKHETREQKELRERVIKQAIGGEEALRRGSKLRISDKDVEFLRFLARFRFANARHISQMYAEREDTSARRLRRLRERGLVLSNTLYGTKPVFFVSDEGMILSGYSYKTLRENDINLASFSHMFGINHIAANLMGANVDVLDFGDSWPEKNRRVFDERTMRYKFDFGENLVSEYEIQSSLGKRRTNTKSEIYKPKAQADLKMALGEWKQRLQEIKSQSDKEKAKKELLEHVYSSPEMIHENEWMWALYPDNPANLAHHVPDLVVKRPRNPDGSPNSIAVELELNLKNSNDSYIKTLTAFKNDKNMYKEVVWVSPQKTIRSRIEKIARDVGLWDTGKIRIIPLYYEHGEWGNIDMWKI